MLILKNRKRNTGRNAHEEAAGKRAADETGSGGRTRKQQRVQTRAETKTAFGN
jgi:hypothetical protein